MIKPSSFGTFRTCRIKNSMTALLLSLLATCSTRPSYASEPKPLISHVRKSHFTFNSDSLTELNKINDIATNYQSSKLHSFILVDTVAVCGNNGRQESQNLLNTVQHHTLFDVFLCLSFISLPFMGELRFALAVVFLWWGGDRNKPFIRRILSAVVLRFLTLPAALHLGQSSKHLPVEKV